MNLPKNKRWKLRLGALAVGVLVTLVQSANAEQLLRWKFTAGESLRYQFKQNTQTETAGAGKQMRVTIDSAMTVTWKIEAVDPQNVATISQTIDQFSVTMTTDKLDPITYDSAAKTPPVGPAREIANGVSKLIGASCRIQMTHRGEIVAVEPSAELKQALEGSTGQTPANQAVSMLTPDGMSRMLRQAAVILPEKPVSDGSKWEATQETPIAFGTLLQHSQFIYGGVVEQDGSQLDKITVETTFTLMPSADKPSATKLKEGQQTGTLWFDSTQGRFAKSELTQRLVTERPYRDATIRVQSTSNLNMALVK